MRRGDARLGEEIRRNRKRAGLTQAAVGLVFGVSPDTVGKWERGQALPSAVNYRALCKAGLLDPGADGRDGVERKRPQAVPPEPVEGAIAGLGVDTSDLLSDARSFRDDEERLLIAMFRMLSPAQQEAFLKIARVMKPATAEAGTAAEEGEAETDRTERAPEAGGE
ncbi:MAG: helix-turn-helix domain-containing protein [Rhodospirillales bacterium]|nr:helix-turn-helix domain-containing protein [Rhodospirillales bacterium]